MNRTEFIRKVVANTAENKYTQKEIDEVLDAAKKVLTDAMIAGEKVSFVGFGTFEVAERAERIARNPQSGEEITVPAHKVPKFKFGKAVREAVKNS